MAMLLFFTFDLDLFDPDLFDLDLEWRSLCYTCSEIRCQSTSVPNLVTVDLILSEKNGNVTYLTFDLDLFDLDLGWGHHATYILKRVVTKYLCAKFGDCRFKKNGKVTLLTFDLDFLTLTLGEGHHAT